MSTNQRTALVAVAIAILAAVTAFGFIEATQDESAPPRTVTAPDVIEGDLETPPNEPDALKDSTPEDVPRPELERGRRNAEKLADELKPSPVGGAQVYNCTKDFSGGVWGSSGRKSQFVLHYTVSPNRPGSGDVRGIQSYFKRTRIASSHYIIDFEGNCVQMVPLDKNAWTQGAFNPPSISVEIIATGSESRGQWESSLLFRRGILAGLVRDNLRRIGAPLRFRNPVGCSPLAGYTDHNSLECGNSHHDVTPNFPYATFQRQLTDGTGSVGCASKRTKQIADRLDFHRNRRAKGAKGQNRFIADWERAARGRRRGLVVQGSRLRRKGQLTKGKRANLRCRTNVLNRRITP